ncbi:MAG: hypothetical protein FWH36_00815 [Lentimicrobiaceae bacterium]|nr:hypothetical protein [Lentimicrobiaceae bacterium]
MCKQIKQIANVILAAVALAMGVAVVVLPIVDQNVATNSLIDMLGIAVVALGVLTLNKITEKEKNK